MIVIALEHCPENLRGLISKYLNEIRPLVFVGEINAKIRAFLWNEITETNCEAVMVISRNNEQGFETVSHGYPDYSAKDFDGVSFTEKRHILSNYIVKNLWAKTKPYKALLDHMYETGITATALCERGNYLPIVRQMANYADTTEENMTSFIGFFCALHDIGKAHPDFQLKSTDEKINDLLYGNSLAESYTDGFRHEEYSRDLIRKYFLENNPDTDNEGWVAEGLADVQSFHHQGKTIYNQSEYHRISDVDMRAKWDDIHQSIFMRIKTLFPYKKMHFKREGFDAFLHMLLSILIFSDWAASNPKLFSDKGLNDFSGRQEYLGFINSRLDVFMRENRLLFNPIPKTTFKKMFPFIQTPNSLQKCVIKATDENRDNIGLCIIEGPCGEGKTEAGLYIATQGTDDKSGLFFGLPTSATAESMLERVNKTLETMELPSAELFSSLAVFDKSKADWFLSNKQAIFQSNAIGTVDQAMLSAMCGKYQILRLGGIMSKSVILDEIHAYDSYMLTIINALVNNASFYDCPITMMSATLPFNTKNEIIGTYLSSKGIKEYDYEPVKGYPIITIVMKDGEIKQYTGELSKGSKQIKYELISALNNIPAMCEHAMTKVANGGCLCLICNSVDDAINAYNYLKTHSTEDTDLMLAHGRKVITDKKADTKKLIAKFGKDRSERPSKAIVVATQIIEQSIDVDFDYLCTCIAPIDLIIQRLGRMHRHSDKGTIREKTSIDIPLTVFMPKDEGCYGITECIYKEKSILDNTCALLISLSGVMDIPGKNPDYIEKVYSNIGFDKMMLDSTKSASAGQVVMKISKRKRNFTLDKNNLKNTPPTRFSEYENIDIALVDSDIYNHIDENIRLIRESRTVSISESKFAKFAKAEKTEFGDLFVFLMDENGAVYGDENAVITYTAETGLVFTQT